MARLLWLLPVGLLQACAGTPVAEQLERSFALPEDRQAQLAAPVPAVRTSPTVASPTAEKPSEPVPKTVSQPKATDPPMPVQEPKPRAVASQRLLQEPYRITIRLAGADPAAPAEAVTRALREADVGFAVERIERVEP